MAERVGTKTPYERETDEAERLVRPAPKVKPPRRDLRRENVQTEPDPDLDSKDKDLSRNRKDIGGSVGARVLSRWAKSLPAPAGTTKRPVPQDKLPKAPAPAGASSKKVKVRHKDTGKVVEVSEATLKESPGKYEPLKNKPSLAPAGKSKSVVPKDKLPKAPVPAGPEPAKKPAEVPAPASEPKVPAPAENSPKSAPSGDDQSARDALHTMASGNPGLESALQDFVKPGSDIYILADKRPEFPVDQILGPRLRGQKLPPGINTLGDMLRVMALSPSTTQPAKSKGKGKGKTPTPTQVPVSQPAGPTQVPAQTTTEPSQQPKPFKYQAPVEDKHDRASRDALQALAKEHPELAAALKDLTKAKSQFGQDAQSNPQFPASMYLEDVLKGKDGNRISLPEDIHNLEDLQRVMALPVAKEEKAPKALKTTPKAPKEEKARKWDDDSGVDYEDVENINPAAGQPDRPYSKAEADRAMMLALNTFPQETAHAILLSKPRPHPDEINQLVQDYQTASQAQVSPKNLDKFGARVSKFFNLDPSQVQPPKTVKTAEGEIKFEDLPPEQKPEAYRKHQMRVVAMSLAAQKMVANSLASTGASKDLAGLLGEVILTGKTKDTSKLAEEAFYKRIHQDDHTPERIPNSTVKKVLGSAINPNARKMAVGYFQSQDYQEARKIFLDPSSKSHISELQHPSEIARGLLKSAEFLRKRSARYPADATPHDVSMLFRDRVMKQLAKLSPTKAQQVQGLLDEQDNAHYEKELQRYHNQSRAGKTGPAPVKPPRYDLQRGTQKQINQAADESWKDFFQLGGRPKAARVLDRYLEGQPSDSTYLVTHAMGNRKAVYWGIDPNLSRKPYEPSSQLLARDLGEVEFSRILKAAKEWLKAPVLASEGGVRDTQLRAALDLAIRKEGCESILHPTLYNMLLARLAGVPEDQTLLTVTASKRETMSQDKVTLKTAQAENILARLDHMAAEIQSKAEQWGMPFKLAKQLVNTLDKIADDLEGSTFGTDSMLRRQASVLGISKTAEVVQHDSDEEYMSSFENPMEPVQTDSDEGYMKAFDDDQSSAVRHGKSTSGRPLAK